MPPKQHNATQAILRQVADEGVYPVDAYEFLLQGLNQTVAKIHGDARPQPKGPNVTGRQLCTGLREYAQERWGMLAPEVLRRWNITSTLDFGKIVFVLVERGLLRATSQDSINDYRNVYDLRKAFEPASTPRPARRASSDLTPQSES